MQEDCNSNPPVITGIYGPNKSGARHHRSLKFDSGLKAEVCDQILKPFSNLRDNSYIPVYY